MAGYMSEKSIALGKDLKEMLKTEKYKVSGEELIRLLLTAEVDLLWNGGIGTWHLIFILLR